MKGVAVVSVERDDAKTTHGLPLTGPQLGIWNAQRFDPESGRYLVGEVLEIVGDTPVDVDLLAEAIRRTVAEAENMRLRFRETAEGPRQFVTAAEAVLRPTVDLRAAADPVALAHEAVALERARAAEDCRAMVDRQLYNYTLIRVTDRQVWCVQLYHHLIVDGYSAALLSRRVAAHYTALRRGKPAPKPTFGTIAALVAEEREYRAGAQFELERRFWRDQLTPWPDLDGRGRHLGGAVERTLRAEAVLSAETLARLREYAENYGITWADALVASYAAFLNRELGTSDVVVSMLLMGRVGRAALTTPAMAVNVLPLRLPVRADDRLGDLAPRVAEALRAVRAHQRYSGHDLARDFHGYGAGELLHGVGINLKVFDFALDFDGARGVLRNVAGGPPEDLGLTVTPLPDGTVLLGFEPDARTNDPADVRRRIDGLVRVIDAFTGDDKPPVGALELLAREERARLLAARSGAAATDNVELVTDALDRLVAERPDAVVLAAGSGESQWTAAEFGARVNRLARWLLARGVRPETVVGVALPRTPDLVVALFAVWRAGGVFLPLDPEHPLPRLHAVIDDATPDLVLSAGELAARLAATAADRGTGAAESGAVRPESGRPPIRWVDIDAARFRDELDRHSGTPRAAEAVHGAEAGREQLVGRRGDRSLRTGSLVSLPADSAADRGTGRAEATDDSRVLAAVASAPQDHGGSRDGAAVASSVGSGTGAGSSESSGGVDPRHGAYLIYTSGSTGRPKGVLVEHGALARLLAAHRAGMYADTAARAGRPLAVAHTTSFAFDAALDPLLWLLDGHRIHVYDSEIRRDPAALVAAFARDGIDVVDGTPTFAAALVEHGLADTAPRLLALGGEACPPELWQRVQHAGIDAVNLYGPTEATVDALTAPVDGARPAIGAPVPGARIYLLDNALQAVADHRVGELYLAGPQLARGYLGRPGATADRFVADPYGPPGARMYRTGDRARWVPGRGYEYVGRVDNQVKIRGHRVELGEVEAALGALPEVRAAVADIREISGRPTLIGYVVPAGAAPNVVELRSRLADAVPDHMVPSRLVVVDDLPHTVNGKIDRAALPEPPSDTGGRLPSTPAEIVLCAVVGIALGHDAVSVDEDFFGVGGDSITAISVSSRLRERGLVLSPQELLSRRALSELAASATTAGAAATPGRPASRGVALPQAISDELTSRYGEIADVLPLSPLQEGLLFHALRDGGDDVYTMTARFELDGPADAERLSAAFERMLARHPNLGAAFRYEDFDQPVQVVPAVPRASFRVEDLRDRAAGDAERIAAELERRAGTEPFDIAEPPLLRVVLIRLTDTAHRLVLIAHHLLADGWSVPIMLRETLAIYHGDGENLPAPGYYGDYLAWLTGRDTAAAVQRWSAYLRGVPAPTLVGTAAGRRLPAVGLDIDLPDTAGADLESLGRRYGLTMSTLVQGAWSMVLAEQVGRTDVVFGAVISGRPADLPEVEKTVGLFSNTVPVRLRLDVHRPLVEQLGEFQRACFDMQAHGYLGLATVERTAGLGRLFDTLVVFENFPKSGLRQPDTHDVRVTDVVVHSLTHFPITVTARPGERFRLMLHHDPAAVPDSTAARFAQRLGAVLTAVTADPAATVAAVTAATTRRETHGGTLADWGTVVDPKAPAVTFADTTIDYGEFLARANRLARWLIARGIGPETVVALAMPRTIDAVVAAHAIVRAGGVYLPVDPEQPAQRIQRILETAAPALTLETLDGVDTSGFADTELTDAERIAPLRPANTAYLLFTSGSTGVPKGVAVSHESIVNTFEWLWEQQRFGPGDTVLYRTPPIFDASLLELYLPLLVGARIVLTRPDGHRDPYYQTELMRAERVSAVQMTTSMLTVLAEETDLDGCADLRCVITGGEALPPATAHRVRELTGARVHNLYGPTEAAVCITYHEAAAADTASVPIGRPAKGSGVRVLDDRLRPVPAGSIGELYLIGVQLAGGYLARPDLTAAAFVADPYAVGARMYRTGDLVKWNPNGELDYLGRGDSQVKLRGQRIELGDIESALLTCAGVAQAAVLLREDTPGDQRLVAYLIPRGGAALDPDTIRAELRTTLPAYMIPVAYVVLDQIPRTASEKIDRKALPVPSHDADPADSTAPGVPGGRTPARETPGESAHSARNGVGAVEHEPTGRDELSAPVELARTAGAAVAENSGPAGGIPAASSQRAVEPELRAVEPELAAAGGRASVRGAAETTDSPTEVALVGDIRAAMAAVLSAPEIGVDDDFFAAGGHSLTAVRLTGRLRRTGLDTVLDDIFAAPTARALAARIGARGAVLRPADAYRTGGSDRAASGKSAGGTEVPGGERASGADGVLDTDGAGGIGGGANPEGAGGGDRAATSADAHALLGSRLDHVLDLRATGSAAPLFCVHPIGGTAWQFGPLARLLRADRPIIGLQLPALRDRDFHADTLEDLARHYRATIRRIQPHGPYRLLGYSLGGNIVHAMAAALEAEGESLAYVGLVDSHPLASLADQAARALTAPAELDRLLPELPSDAPELADAVRAAATALLGMVTRSTPPRYRGSMALYAADTGTQPGRAEAQLSGWLADGARLVVRRLPYSHFDIVSPTGWTEVAALLDADPAIRE
ncbi:non-ribosomal peptide synthetase [Nocardia sp. CC227C]|uniref:non-ribosomal peptide synthetase n=1 Tax=Nocardia sp. CC227C TaxID=3044562 RepID=UPI00278C35EC|nr:non-ribosomal peptide synthetase [Nocardia sp. CC227C]